MKKIIITVILVIVIFTIAYFLGELALPKESNIIVRVLIGILCELACSTIIIAIYQLIDYIFE